MRNLKSSLAVILSICILFSTIIPALAVDSENADTNPQSTVLYGDADTDGDVDMQDLLVMEKFIAGKEVSISEKQADVNADGYVNDTDVQMLRDYLVGNIDSLTPDLVTISFVTDGGGEFEPMQVGKGYGIVKEMPTPAKPDYIFTGWIKSDGSEFYKEDAITEDITLVAQYESINKQEELKIDSYAVTDCETDVKFNVTGAFSSAEQVKENITLVPKDGSDPVEIKVEKNDDGTFSVGAAVSFTPGASYELTLGDGVFFVDKEETIRSVDFIIKKTEGDRLFYNENVKFIKDTAEMVYTIEGKKETQDVLEAALLNNEKNNDDIKGSFVMSGGGLAKSDIVCIYTGTDPRERDYTKDENDNYDGEAIAYVRITGVNGNTYSFESLDNDDISEVILMPDSIPFEVEELPKGETGIIYKDDYDANARVKLGFKEAPEYKKSDFLIFYMDAFETLNAESDVVYGQVTNVLEDTVEYEIVSKEYIESFMGMFVKNEVDKEKILENINEEELLDNVTKQVEESGFAEESAGYMLQSAMQDEEVKEAMLKNGMTKEEFNYFATSSDITTNPVGAMGRTKVTLERDPVFSPSLIKGNQFKNGVGVRLDVGVILSVDTKLNKVQTSLKIDLSAAFEQEIAFGIDVDVEDEWTWYGPIPIPKELSVYTSVDIQSYTSVSVGATMYSVHEDVQKKTWKALSDKFEGDPWTQGVVKMLDQLAVKAHKMNKKSPAYQTVLEQMEELTSQIGEIDVDGIKMKYDEVCDVLEAVTVSNSFADNAQAEDEPEAKVSMQKLMDRYSELMENESDWVQLAYYELFDKDFNIKIVAINVKVTLVIRGNINLSLGADFEYKVGKRYNFWIHCVSCEAGSSEQDLVDERFAFQLYVMGTIGLRAGVKVDVGIGIISTKLGSIGANIEFGPYLKIWGYFCYVYTRLRPANSYLWEEEETLAGAVLLDFGLYVTVKFKAQVFDDLFKFEPTIYDGEFPLLSAGTLENVYDFANDPKDESLKISDYDNYSANGITMELPESYRLMKCINLRTGEQFQKGYDVYDFKFTSSNRYFKVSDNGTVTVEAPNNAEYLEGEITVTWKNSKLGFSKFDMAITIPVYWTSLTEDQINEKHTASVAVGNPTDGYNTVWSGRYTRLQEFSLPTEAEILELIKYDSYVDENGINLKYGEIKGYTAPSTGLTIKEDTQYYFDIDRQQYTVTVNNVQNVDGSLTSRTYKALYGDTISFADLESTGTNDTTNNVYTKFANVSKEAGSDVIFDMQTTINLSFADEYGTNAQLSANYIDNFAIATYTFDGIDAPAVEVKFKKGEIPYFEGLNEYVEKYGGAGTTVLSVSPVMEKVEHSVTYIISCKKAVPTPKYTLTFDTQGGTEITSRQYTAGYMILVPTSPIRRGYEFGGWYTDKKYTTKFSFEKMPEQDTTIYAKWIANKYTVTYKVLNGEEKTETIYYDELINLTPADDTNELRFLYWELDKQRVNEGTIFTWLNDITLEACWDSKNGITINIETQHYTDVNEHPFKITLYGTHENMDDTVKFVCKYRKAGSGDEYSEVVPSQKGVYDVFVTRETDSFYEPFEKEISSALIIGKIDLSLKNPNVYTKGKTLVISRPDGYKGDGVITYSISGPESYSNTTGIFNNLSSGTYNCFVTVASGTYYEGATTKTITAKVSGISTSSDFSYSVDVKTGKDGGTWNDASVRLNFRDGTNSGWTFLSDPDRGSTISKNLGTKVYPWAISGSSVKLDLYLAYVADKWWCEYVNVKASRSGSTVNKKIIFDWWLGPDESKSISTSDFKRQLRLKNSDQKYFNGTDYVTLYGDNATTSYLYDYSGEIADQYYTAGYDPMTVYSPPTFSVSASNSDLLRYVQYTDVTKFKLDIEGIKEYVQSKNGYPSFNYTVTYSFPSSTCTTTTFKKTINVDTSMFTAKSNSLYATGSAQSGCTLNADKVDTGVGELVTVPVKLQGVDPMWGILADVEFDTSVLEFAGFENDGIFTPAEFTTQNDLTKANFKFLAANDELENITADGTLINLKFKVKENAQIQAYDIRVNVQQAIDVDGEVKEIGTSNGWVNVTEPTTAPPTTETTEEEVTDTTEPTTDVDATEPKETEQVTEPAATEPTAVDTTELETTEPSKDVDSTDSKVTQPTTKMDATESNEKTTENPTEQKNAEEDIVDIPDGDRNTNLNMILLFITVCSAGVFMALKKRKV